MGTVFWFFFQRKFFFFVFSTQFLCQAICTQRTPKGPSNRRLNEHGIYIYILSHLYPENPEGTQVFVGSYEYWIYLSLTTRTRNSQPVLSQACTNSRHSDAYLVGANHAKPLGASGELTNSTKTWWLNTWFTNAGTVSDVPCSLIVHTFADVMTLLSVV